MYRPDPNTMRILNIFFSLDAIINQGIRNKEYNILNIKNNLLTTLISRHLDIKIY